MKKIILGSFLLMLFYAGAASAETLDQYKARQATPPTMEQLVASSDLRASLNLEDLQAVSAYCQKGIVGEQSTLEVMKKVSPDRVPTSESRIAYLQKQCPIIAGEVSARNVPPPAPVVHEQSSVTVQAPAEPEPSQEVAAAPVVEEEPNTAPTSAGTKGAVAVGVTGILAAVGFAVKRLIA